MIDYAEVGHCTCCHRNLIVEEVIGGKVQKRFHADFGEVEFLLNDGSKMRVNVCIPCQQKNEHSNIDKIMETEIKGWKHQTDKFVKEGHGDWTQEKADKYMARYSKLEIVTPTQGHDADSLKEKLRIHTEAKLQEKVDVDVIDYQASNVQ